MGAMVMIARARLRANRRSTVALVLLVGVAVAVVLAALAGARRTDRALADFVAADRGADGMAAFMPVQFGGNASEDLAPEADRLAAIAGVEQTHRFTNALVAATDPTAADGHRRLTAWLAMEPGGLTGLTRPYVVDGRLPDDEAVDEIAIDEELARDANLRVGDRYRVQVFTAEQTSSSADSGNTPVGEPLDATVVGVVRRPTDLRDLATPPEAQSSYLTHHDLYMTAALWGQTNGDVAIINPIVAFTVAKDADFEAVKNAIVKDFDGAAFVVRQEDFLDFAGTFKGVQRSISLQSRALQVFAAVAALAGLLLVGQTIGRQIYLETDDTPTLRATGMTRGALLGASLARALPVAIGGTFGGILGAIALSPVMPLPGSIARRAELSPGVHVDWLVLGLGALVAPLLVVFAALLPRRGGTGPHDAVVARSRPTLASRFALTLGSAPAVIGVRFALEPGHGRRAVPVRTAMATAAAAIAIVIGSVGLAASLDGTHDDPTRYGVTWDVSAGDMIDLEEANERSRQVASLPGIDAFSGAVTTTLTVNERETVILFVRRDRGQVAPRVIDGRLPQEGEIALAQATMTELGVDLGKSVEVDAGLGAGPQRFDVVGTIVMNTAGLDVAVSADEGALLDWTAVERLSAAQAEFFSPQSFLVRFDHRVDRAATLAAVRAIFPTSTTPPIEPSDLTNLRDVRLLPLAIGMLVTVLAVGTVGHSLLSAVRRRRNELAVLKTIGFTGRDTRVAVTCQAMIFAAVALVIGVPAGIAGGRWAWSVATSQLGIVNRPEVPILGVAAGSVVVVGLLVAVVVVPARLAGRVSTATLLRDDAG